MSDNGGAGSKKWLWSVLIPIFVAFVTGLGTYLITSHIENEANAKKVATYAELWEEQVTKDTARMWSDFRLDSTMIEFRRKDTLDVTLNNIALRGLGQSSAVPTAKKEINSVFDYRLGKLRSETEFRVATLVYQLNAFRKTGMSIRPM